MEQNVESLLTRATDHRISSEERTTAGKAYVDYCEMRGLLYGLCRVMERDDFLRSAQEYARERLCVVSERLLTRYAASDRSPSNMIAQSIATYAVFPEDLRERAADIVIDDYVARGWHDHLLNFLDTNEFPPLARVRAGRLFIDSRVSLGELGAVHMFAHDDLVPHEIRAYARQVSMASL